MAPTRIHQESSTVVWLVVLGFILASLIWIARTAHSVKRRGCRSCSGAAPRERTTNALQRPGYTSIGTENGFG
jgi:hypothetical protein